MFTWIADTLGVWTWWVLGLVLLGLEVVVPGVYVMWFGLAAIAVGSFAWVVPMTWTTQILLFVVLSVIAVVIGRLVDKNLARGEGESGLNDRARRYVGRSYHLKEPITNGSGRLDIEDTIWRIKGPDLAAGARVRVVAVEASTLIVEAEG